MEATVLFDGYVTNYQLVLPLSLEGVVLDYNFVRLLQP